MLSNTVSNDSGVYQCVASSAAGVAWAAARLTVNVSRGQPRPPSHLVCTTLSSSSVLLSWEQPIPTSLKAFTIHYLPSGECGLGCFTCLLFRSELLSELFIAQQEINKIRYLPITAKLQLICLITRISIAVFFIDQILNQSIIISSFSFLENLFNLFGSPSMDSVWVT